MALLHHICAVRTSPEPEILETEVPAWELKEAVARLQRRGFETVFTVRTLHGNPRQRKSK